MSCGELSPGENNRVVGEALRNELTRIRFRRALDQSFGQRIFDVALNRAPQPAVSSTEVETTTNSALCRKTQEFLNKPLWCFAFRIFCRPFPRHSVADVYVAATESAAR